MNNLFKYSIGLIKVFGALLLSSQLIAAPAVIPQQLKTQSASPNPNANSWVLMDAATGWVLAAKDEQKELDPASLTKLMTAYVVFELLEQGKYSASDNVFISNKAWKAPGSRMFAEVNSQVSLGDLLKGLIIQSGNDSAIALAEHVGGTEEGFAILMNEKAQQLGMLNSQYKNSSGLPEEGHYTTAYDTAVLSRAIIRDHPGFYHLFSVRSYKYNDIDQPNRNNLLWRHDSYDGLKTGYTKAAGYCLVGSAKRENTRFIAVVMGSESKKSRVQAVQSLIEFGFAKYETAPIFKAGQPVKSLPLFKGQVDAADIGVSSTVSVLLPKGEASKLDLGLALPDKLSAPLSRQQAVGSANLSFNGLALGKVELTPLQDYPTGSLWTQLVDMIRSQFQ